jgi:hypothetical protein
VNGTKSSILSFLTAGFGPFSRLELPDGDSSFRFQPRRFAKIDLAQLKVRKRSHVRPIFKQAECHKYREAERQWASKSRQILAFPKITGQFTDWPGQNSFELHGRDYDLSRPNESEANTFLWFRYGMYLQYHFNAIQVRQPISESDRTAGIEELTRAESNGKSTSVLPGNSPLISEIVKLLSRNKSTNVDSMTGNVKSQFKGKRSVQGRAGHLNDTLYRL